MLTLSARYRVLFLGALEQHRSLDAYYHQLSRTCPTSPVRHYRRLSGRFRVYRSGAAPTKAGAYPKPLRWRTLCAVEAAVGSTYGVTTSATSGPGGVASWSTIPAVAQNRPQLACRVFESRPCFDRIASPLTINRR